MTAYNSSLASVSFAIHNTTPLPVHGGFWWNICPRSGLNWLHSAGHNFIVVKVSVDVASLIIWTIIRNVYSFVLCGSFLVWSCEVYQENLKKRLKHFLCLQTSLLHNVDIRRKYYCLCCKHSPPPAQARKEARVRQCGSMINLNTAKRIKSKKIWISIEDKLHRGFQTVGECILQMPVLKISRGTRCLSEIF